MSRRKKKTERGLFLFMGVVLFSILSLFLFLGVNLLSSIGTDSTEQTYPQPSTLTTGDLELKERIKKYVSAYTSFNCVPKYVTEVNDWGDGVVTSLKQMNVYDEKISWGPQHGPTNLWAPQHILNGDPSDFGYGNLAIRATYLASSYHYYLSNLYTDIYDIFDTELKSVRKDFTRFKTLADRAGKKLCPIATEFMDAEVLDAPEAEKVQAIHNELVDNWYGFSFWWQAVDSKSYALGKRLDEEVWGKTPTCEEFPSKDGKYVVVKCSMP